MAGPIKKPTQIQESPLSFPSIFSVFGMTRVSNIHFHACLEISVLIVELFHELIFEAED